MDELSKFLDELNKFPILEAYVALQLKEAIADQAKATFSENANSSIDQEKLYYSSELSRLDREMNGTRHLANVALDRLVNSKVKVPKPDTRMPISDNDGNTRLKREAAIGQARAASREIDSLLREYYYAVEKRKQRVYRLIVSVITLFVIAAIIEPQIRYEITTWQLTATAEATDNLVARMRAYGSNYLRRNSDWTPVVREFNSVPMVLVPPGCFMMGSQLDERPVHQICFNEPFWIDQTEVTQEQFVTFGGRSAHASAFVGSRRPVENITWLEARDFCVQRGARLPTEAEWEYAARGPDGWIYPWGNAFIQDNAVWRRGSSLGSMDVGSIPSGASWVGALDMVGNVWEWTNSLYKPYPYDATDGRESYTGLRANAHLVLRGGSWISTNLVVLRAANRDRRSPYISSNHLGFRCARSA